jgi:cytochrome P450
LRYFTQISRDYGDVVPIHMGPERILFINRPGYIKHILQDNHANYRKSKFYAKLRPILGNGMLLAEGETWLKLRRVAQPGFQGPRIESMASAVVEATSDMLGRWEHAGEGRQTQDICAEMMRLALDVVFRTLMNVRLGDESGAVYDALGGVLREAEKRIWEMTNIAEYLPTRRNREFRKALKALDGIVYRVIDERRKNPGEHDDLLSLLMAAYDDPDSPMESAKQLRDEVMSFIMGGHETTAAALAWAWYLLSMNPEAARRLREEAHTVLGDRQPTYRDLQDLSYAKAVFQETVRLYPPVWTMSRTALDDDELGPYRVRKGTTVMLCHYAVHRNPRYWKNPDDFDPERFLEAGAEEQQRFAYFPFGGGPRGCIGSRFALMEGPLVLAMVSRAFGLELAPGTPVVPEPTITLRPRGGIQMTVRKQP